MHEIALTADMVAPFRYGIADQGFPQAPRYEEADPLAVALPGPQTTYEEADPLPLVVPVLDTKAPMFFRVKHAGSGEERLIRR